MTHSTNKFTILNIFFITLWGVSTFAQTGPGGVGNATGASSQPQNVLWLRANTGVSTTGALVDSWTDQSGNGNSATGGGATRPTYTASDANFNNLGSITFSNAAVSNFFLQVPDNDNLDNTSALSVFFVLRPTSLNSPPLGILSKRTGVGANESYRFEVNTNYRYRMAMSTEASANIVSANSSVNQQDIFSFIMNGTSQNGYYDGTNNTSRVSAISTIPNTTSNLFVGSFDNTVNTNFEGALAEVIMYRTALNEAQRQIVENYLSAKYNSSITNDFYAGDTPGNGNHDFEMVGIGQQSGAQHTLANSAGFILSPANGTIETNGEFVMAAHNGVANAVSVANLGVGVQQRWARTWYIDKTTAGTIDANITFDFSDGIAGQFPANKDNYVLLRYDGANYSIVAIPNGDKTLVGDQISFRVGNADLTDGIYTLGTTNLTNSPVNGVSNRTWYSYQSGNWSDPLSWTLDGSVTPLYVNPSSETPSITDNVIITSGRTITVNVNNLQTNSIQVTGTLDLLASTGHNLVDISGSGRIRMSGVTDNFPSGDATDFADPTVGGTLEIKGTGVSLNVGRTWNNVEINMTNNTDVVTLTGTTTVNGNVTITKGLLQFNDGTATNRTLTVYGDAVVESTGGIRVSTANARHEFNLYGDFYNNGGTAYFTNRVAAITNAEATDGIVDLNTVSSSQDQLISCNGVTRFYRIEINKGTNDAYKTSIEANDASNFNLFGAANYAIDVAQAATNDNAIGLIYGTVELGTNVNVPALNTNGNLAIYEGAQLWVNGATVVKTGSTAIVPYGKLRVSAGSLTADVPGGITTRENGIIQVEGGTVTVRQIRTSVAGVSAVGSYIQSGGNVIVTGGSISNDYSVFSLTYTGNVFSMSGGTLTVRGGHTGTDGLRGAIFINSDPANVSVTGGTVVMEANNATTYRVTSRAAFWNVITRGTGGTRTIELAGTTSGTGGGLVALGIQPLVVLNDFTIENNTTFQTNNANVTIGGSFEIQNGGTYTHGTNTTTINGLGVSSLTFGNVGATQTFNNLTINRDTNNDEVVITSGNATAIRVNGTLQIDKGIFNYGNYIVSARGTVTLATGTVVGKSTSTGKLLMDGTTDQTINSDGASIYNIELNNTDASPVVTLSTGNLTVLGTLTLTAGIFDINTNKLTLSGSSASISGSGFSATKMIQTAGNASDGGLEMYFDANETLNYPIGVSAKYTPATATISSFSDDGFVRIIPRNGILQTTNLSGGADILGYYWRVDHSGFSVLPSVSYVFSYNGGDVGGTETNYVPGKVLEVNPFTRSFENDVNKVDDAANTITFNGAGSGFTLEEASYTAGGTTRFTGTVEIYYVRSNGFWDQTSTWSFSRGGGIAGTVPGAGDIVVMRRTSVSYSGIVTVRNTETAAKVIFDDENGFSSGCPRVIIQTGTPYSSNFGVVEVADTHQGGTLNGTTHGAVIQYNVDNAYAGVFPGGDFGGFNNYLNALVIYSWQTGNGTITLSSSATEYPQLWFEGGTNNRHIQFPNTNVVVKGRTYITGGFGSIRVNGGATSATLHFEKDLYIGSGCCGAGTFQFQGAGSANQTVQVDGNVVFTTGGSRNINILTPASGTLMHKLIVKGNIDVVTAATLNLGSGLLAETNVILELQGTGTNTFTNTGTATLFRIVMNKGTDISSTFSFNDNFTLTGATNTATKAITLQNGLLILNDGAINVVLSSGGGDFNIPATAGLEVAAGTVSTTTASTGITLDGLLRISGGTATIDAGGTFDNYIEYSNSGNAGIEVTSGTLTVASQIRRGLTSTTGVLKYTQSNGTVTVGRRSAPQTTRGVFEVLNTGSEFNHSGGSLTLVRGINSTTVPSLWLEPASASITSGSTITIGDANTPTGVNSQNIGIRSSATLNNLTIAGANNPLVKVYTLPLVVGGNLTVSASTTLNANTQNVTIGGNFTVDGSYVPANNTTTFNNSGAAAISGATALFNFYNFIKSGSGTLTLAKDITINNDLDVLSATLATATFTVNLKRHAQIDGTLTATSGSGLVFNGSSQQQLTRASAGTSTLGIVTINNSNGVIVPDGNGYNFNVTTGLRLQQGVFDIGGSLLSLGTSAIITPVNAFSITNMIQTNSSFTDFGVRKQFPTGYTTNFVFPVGQLAYTPVTFNFSSPTHTTGASGTPTITVRPANEKHPSVIEDSENPDPEITDADNVLQYHWIINADNVANTFKSVMTLNYAQTHVEVTAPYTEADYLAARILSDANPTLLINKFNIADVDETNNTATFYIEGVTDAGISGEYFAGIDTAIPDSIPTYTTTGSGDIDDPVYSPVVPGGGIPTGAYIVVATGHTLTFPSSSDNVSLYKTEIQTGATVVVESGSIGHRLGDIAGVGDLQLNGPNPVLPTAVYTDFFSCSGGGLIYAGTGDYEVLGSITALRNLTVSGTGTRTLANNDITICNNLTIQSGEFTNSNNRTITVQNDFINNGGTYTNSTGTLTITRDLTQTSGTFTGGTGGTKTIGRDLVVNGGTFTSGSGSSNIIRVNRNMTVADAATFTGGTSDATGMRYVFQGTVAQLLTGTFTTTRFINRLEINNSTGLTLAGNVTIDRELVFTSGNITPGANTLLMAANAVANPTEGKSTSFVNGKLYKVLSSAGSSFIFPIGKGNRWRTGSVNNVSGGGATWDMEYIAAAATSNPIVNNITPVAPILKVAMAEHWTVSDGAAVGLTAGIGLSWGIESDVSTVQAEREALKILVWDDANSEWDNYGAVSFSAGHTQSRGTFTSSSSVGFSENIVTLGSTETANNLPIELILFKAEAQQGYNRLVWETASEQNNDRFEIERSADGEGFKKMGIVNGHGTTQERNSYRFDDVTPLIGKNYYRLKQVDINGSFSYSEIVLVTVDKTDYTTLEVDVFPNPLQSASQSTLTARVVKDNEHDVSLTLYSIAGVRHTTQTIESADFIFEKELKIPSTLIPGIYIIEVTQGDRRVMKRLVVE